MTESEPANEPQAEHEHRPDLGLTHVALTVRDVDESVAFYRRYAGMDEVHRRHAEDGSGDVVWISDLTRPFVIVLIPAAQASAVLTGFTHLGRGCASRDEVDRLAATANEEGRAVFGPHDYGPPVGYWAFIADPDGNNLELAFGQEVAFAVEEAADHHDVDQHE